MFYPTISIIIPTHNRPDYLRAAIGSIVQQVYSDWEIIVVDDGSLEGAYMELQLETSTLPITWYKQEQAGPGVARKTGLALAKGEYVAFLDDDDYYLPEHLSRLVEATNLTNRQIIRSGLIGKKQNGSLVNYPGYKNDRPTLEQYWKMPSNLTALLFTMEAARKVPIDTVRTTIEDFTWLIRILSHYDLYQIDAYTAVYVLHDTNRNNVSSVARYLEDRLEAMEAAYQYSTVSKRVSKGVKYIWITHQYLHFSRNSMRFGNWEQALSGVRESLNYISRNNIRELTYTAYFAVKTIILQLLAELK